MGSRDEGYGDDGGIYGIKVEHVEEILARVFIFDGVYCETKLGQPSGKEEMGKMHADKECGVYRPVYTILSTKMGLKECEERKDSQSQGMMFKIGDLYIEGKSRRRKQGDMYNIGREAE